MEYKYTKEDRIAYYKHLKAYLSKQLWNVSNRLKNLESNQDWDSDLAKDLADKRDISKMSATE